MKKSRLSFLLTGIMLIGLTASAMAAVYCLPPNDIW